MSTRDPSPTQRSNDVIAHPPTTSDFCATMSAQITDLKPLGLKPVNHQHHEPQRNDPFVFDHRDDKIHVLLCASGSVATIKIPNMIDALAKHKNVRIRLVFTAAAANFLQGQSAEQPSIQDLE